MPAPTKSFEVVELLVRHHVAFIIVGMTAGVLRGAPAVTFDLDILYSRDDANVTKLLAALKELEAVFREALIAQLTRKRPRNAPHTTEGNSSRGDWDGGCTPARRPGSFPLQVAETLGMRGFAELISLFVKAEVRFILA